MKRKHLLLGAAVLLLAALNFLQWKSPDGVSRDRSSARPGTFRAEDFQLKAGFATAEAVKANRNLFQLKLPPAPPVKKITAPPGPPPKTPEQLAEEAARAELGQIKLVGVVFRGEKGQAFLVKGDQLYMVQSGEKVGERFQVEVIRPDSVQLKDPATQVSGQIPVSGK